MRLILGSLVIFAMLTGSANAQSSRITNWTEKAYSEEDNTDAYTPSYSKYLNAHSYFRGGWLYKLQKKINPNFDQQVMKGYDLLDFLSGIRCSGRYCDNKVFKYTTDFKVPEVLRNVPAEVVTIRAEEGSGEAKCPAGSYIAQMWCESGSDTDYCAKLAASCVKPLVVSSKPPVCGMTKEISDEGASRLENEVTLKSYQLFDGMKCEGKWCDNLTMSSCNIYGTDNDVLGLTLEGATWKKVNSMLGGSSATGYTAGLEIASSTGHEVGTSVTASTEVTATAGVSGSIGVAEVSAETSVSAGLAVTAQYAHNWNNSKASTRQREISYSCDRLGEHAYGADVYADMYAFSLITKGGVLEDETAFLAVSEDHHTCVYSTSAPPAPVCFPRDCDNEFAINCQKCRNISISEAWDEPAEMVQASYRTEKETLGSFVEFYGRWDWKNDAHHPAETSHLVLHNDTARRETYTLCQDSVCSAPMKGKYTSTARGGSELVLEGVFGEANSRVVFKSQGDGKVTGTYWRDKAVRGQPDGTIELDQL